jgi:hypothetical protein
MISDNKRTPQRNKAVLFSLLCFIVPSSVLAEGKEYDPRDVHVKFEKGALTRHSSVKQPEE